MAAADFVKFYSEYLPKHPDIKRQVDGADTAKKFAAAVLAEGKKAGFTFSEDDIEKVLVASIKKSGKGELSEGQLDNVVGGASSPVGTINISPVASLTSVSPGTHASGTIMCPSLF
jgi:hypothetical protein